MIEVSDKWNGEIIKSVTVKTDEDASNNEYCAYDIIIETDKGQIHFWGFHDYSPDMPKKG